MMSYRYNLVQCKKTIFTIYAHTFIQLQNDRNFKTKCYIEILCRLPIISIQFRKSCYSSQIKINLIIINNWSLYRFNNPRLLCLPVLWFDVNWKQHQIIKAGVKVRGVSDYWIKSLLIRGGRKPVWTRPHILDDKRRPSISKMSKTVYISKLNILSHFSLLSRLLV